MEWIKNHLEPVICFFFWLLLVLTTLHFLRTEEERMKLVELEAARSPEQIRRTIEGRLDEVEIENRRIRAALEGKPFVHYELAVRRNPFAPLPEAERVDLPPRPNDNGVLPPPPPPEPKTAFVLRGVMGSPGEYRAIVEERATRRVFVVSQGDEIKEHRVETVDRNKVVLRKDDEEIEIKL